MPQAQALHCLSGGSPASLCANHAIKTTPKNEAICIAGSLYLVGEAIEYFEKVPPFLLKKWDTSSNNDIKL